MGRIWTGDPAHPWAEALAIRGGAIAAVGTCAEAARLRGPATRMIDRPGAFAIPGLVDAHGHMEELGATADEIDLRGVASLDEVARRVKARIAASPGDSWITGRNWDQSLWPGGAFPTAAVLDAVAPARPVWLHRVDGHAGWANSEAMRRAKVTREAKAPADGQILRDRDGNPTGVFVDGAMGLVGRAVPEPDPAGRPPPAPRRPGPGSPRRPDRESTTPASLAAPPRSIATSTARAGSRSGSTRWRRRRRAARSRSSADGPQAGPDGARFEMRAIKLFVDGAMGSRGGLLFESYHDDPGNSGLLLIDPKVLEATTTAAPAPRLAGGDPRDRRPGATPLVLDAYAAARRPCPSRATPACGSSTRRSYARKTSAASPRWA